ncbi:MAG: hypothetical protein ACFFBP_16825 [Promethearchaeota archaeon]
MNEKKDNVICTRVDDHLLTYIQDYSKKYDLSVSKLIRDSLMYYLQYARKDEDSIAPMIFFAKGEFTYLIDNLNEEQMKELADSSYQTALRGIENYILRRLNQKFDPLKIKPRSLMMILNRAILSYGAQNWLNDIQTNIHANKISYAATHNFSSNFSIYLKYFISKFFEPYGYVLNKETIQEKKVHFIFTLHAK